jgi:hypothetical protein
MGLPERNQDERLFGEVENLHGFLKSGYPVHVPKRVEPVDSRLRLLEKILQLLFGMNDDRFGWSDQPINQVGCKKIELPHAFLPVTVREQKAVCDQDDADHGQANRKR